MRTTGGLAVFGHLAFGNLAVSLAVLRIFYTSTWYKVISHPPLNRQWPPMSAKLHAQNRQNEVRQDRQFAKTKTANDRQTAKWPKTANPPDRQ